MNRLEPVYEITEEMMELVNQDITAKDRESVIEKLNELLLRREKMIHSISEPYSLEEKQLGERLIPLNESVHKKMKRIFTNLKEEMQQMQKKKSTNQRYVNPYRNVQVMDGMYMDRKK